MSRLVAIAGAALVLFALAAKTEADPDLWGHLRFGLDTLQAQKLPATDPYSFTQDRPWINHEWLSELVMAAAYQGAGIHGLILLKGVLVFAALLIVWRSLEGVEFPIRLVVIAIAIVGTASVTSTLRPQLWSLLFIALLCRALTDDSLRAYSLPVLFVAWANLHGGWVVGLGILLIWTVADIWANRKISGLSIVLAGTSLVATLATPYGLRLWQFAWQTIHVTRDITEWQPLWRTPMMNWLPCVIVAVAAIWVIVRLRAYQLQAAATLALLAYGSIRVSRIGPFFIGAAVILLAPAIRDRFPVKRAVSPLSGPENVLAIAAGVAAIAAAVWIGRLTFRCIEVKGTWIPPSNATEILRASQAGRLVTSFDWGEYAIWHVGPKLRVSIDGRRETVYSDGIIAANKAILEGDSDGSTALERWRPDYVWLPGSSTVTKRWLTSHGYRLDLDDGQSFVAVRSDLPPLPPAAPASTSLRCFPD